MRGTRLVQFLGEKRLERLGTEYTGVEGEYKNYELARSGTNRSAK